METENSIILSLTIYKLTSLVVGLVSIFFGYKLFVKGIWGQAGDLDIQFKDNKLVLKKAAPGTFFALFGAIIIAITLWKGLEFNKYQAPDATIGNQVNVEKQETEELPQVSPL